MLEDKALGYLDIRLQDVKMVVPSEDRMSKDVELHEYGKESEDKDVDRIPEVHTMPSISNMTETEWIEDNIGERSVRRGGMGRPECTLK